MAVDNVSVQLLGWYDANARALQWRSPPGTPPPSPYRVWLSEIMLQQTTTVTVAPYYARFLAIWPTVEALAATDDDDVMREWAGLGYYARARNLLACARAAVARGGFPGTEIELRTLPGIGGYTAAAIAAIAFGQRAVVVDGNIERVVARLFAVATPLPQAKRALYALADRLTPTARAGDHAQAMMDLGATVCTPHAPKCARCPLSPDCAAFAEGDPARYPVKLAKPAKPVRYGTAYWIEHDGAVLLERRPASGLLGGMLGLPTGAWDSRPVAASGPAIRHVFTHFDLRLTITVSHPPARPALPGEWHPVATIAAAGLPTLFARAAAAVLQSRDEAVQSPSLTLETAA
jgi:A/G-specific adenine glycosylase